MKDILIEFYRGDTYSRDFTITGWSLPISKIYFTVKEDIEKKSFALQKTLGNGITLVEEDEEKKTYNLTICCTDTDDMKVDTDYTFDIEIHSEGTSDMAIKKTIATGTLRLKGSATRTCNEC